MLNVLNAWCGIMEMKLNVEKSKIMHVRKSNVPRSQVNIYCGNMQLLLTDNYKYLGFIFNEHFDISTTVKHVAQSANKALGLLIANIRTMGGVPFKMYTKLYNTLV